MTPDPIWRIRRPPNPEAVSKLDGYAPLFQAMLLSRGIRTRLEAEHFLRSDQPEFHDPFMLNGIEKAVERISEAIESKEKVCIFADYDADGISGASLLANFLKHNDFAAEVYFPDRFQEGYGLNALAIQRLHGQGVKLLITIDCGIRGIAEVEQAQALGMDVIVTDHHLPGSDLPESFSTINPKVPGDPYPFKELAGVGLAYKLANALSLRMKTSREIETYLDYVALGTVADMAPLIGENRHLVQQGLLRLNDTHCAGLEALINVSGTRAGEITASTIGFGLGPRINASGRLASANLAYELLTEENLESAQRQAETLDRLNNDRQRITAEVVARIEENPPSPSDKLVLSFDPEYHQGIVGLAASRVSDRYFRPAIIGKVDETETRASARSIPGFHITQALEQVSDLLLRFGGHAAAAGFTLANKDRERFVDRILEIADRSITDDQLRPVIDIDACIGFDAINPEIMNFLDALEPFGSDNSQPVFCASNVKVLAKRRVGKEGPHLKLMLEGAGRPLEAIAFRKGDLADSLPERVDVAFHVERNNYLGFETLQLRVVDIRTCDSLENANLTEWVNVD
ncbi:MAG: single-stranded-DNA-specific exonuclease RecJ [Anaerolineales bacterium]|nr:MAG: single-stranded-DNA-specific exonuclease RecJ [Anaerolineales bacterium]